MSIHEPIVTEIAKNTYHINEYRMDSMYLLIGTEKAMLIDTGSCFVDLKALIRRFTDLPYVVVNTHCHPDHAAGNCQFDEVWVNPDDMFLLDPGDPPIRHRIHRETEINFIDFQKSWDPLYEATYGVTADDLLLTDRRPIYHPISDGDTFDLGGGRIITAYNVAGHSPGSTAFLDSESRILFIGDFICNTVMVVSSTLRRYLRIRGMYGSAFDRMFSGHASVNRADVLSTPISYLDDYISMWRSLLSGNAEYIEHADIWDPELTVRNLVYGPYLKADGTTGYRCVTDAVEESRLWEVGEAHIVP